MFYEYVRLFNSFPGQPVETLISLIPHFHLSNDTVLDLSNKGLLGNVTAQILQAMWENQVPIRTLNLSGNAINWPEDIEALLPQLTPIEVLDLSNNNFGFDSTTRTAFETFARGLSYLTQLRELHLSSNAIDNGIINNATQIFGEHLRDLTRLEVLNLSNNLIGKTDSTGTQAIGQSLSALTNLRKLDLSGNWIGQIDSNGTQTIGQSLSALTNLRELDLSANWIGLTDSTGAQAIGHSLSALLNLEELILGSDNLFLSFSNYIGYHNTLGTQAIAQSLRSLTKLCTLRNVYEITLTTSIQ